MVALTTAGLTSIIDRLPKLGTLRGSTCPRETSVEQADRLTAIPTIRTTRSPSAINRRDSLLNENTIETSGNIWWCLAHRLVGDERDGPLTLGYASQ